MPFYLSEYIGSGVKGDPFRPVGFDQPGWSAIDLRPDPSLLDGGGLNACLLSVPVAFSDARARFLADDKLESLTNPQKNFLQNRLGVNLSSPTLLRDIVATIMTQPPTGRWKAILPGLLRWEIWLGELLWEAPRASGGAIMTDDFNRASFIGGSISWNNLQSSWVEVGSATVSPSLFGADSLSRAETTAIGGDQYSQAKLIGVSGGAAGDDSGIGVALRIVAASSADYYRFVANEPAGASNLALQKEVASIFTNLGYRSNSYSSGTLMRAEANGSTLSLYMAGVLQSPSVTDTSHSTGQPGIFYSSSIAAAQLDDWEGGDLPPASAGVTYRGDSKRGLAAVS